MADIRPGKEKGKEGLEAFYGRVAETYTSTLRWPDCYDTYNEMRRRDPTLRAMLNAIRMLSGQATWKAEPPTDKAPDVEAAEFLQQCLEDMSHTVDDFMADVFTCLPFGWSSFEICYKRREGKGGKWTSKFDDGKVGWRKLAYRRQSTFDRWEFDDNGGLAGWLVFVGLFNVAGLLTYLSMNHRPVLKCVECGKKRHLMADSCIRCGGGLPVPERRETDLIFAS